MKFRLAPLLAALSAAVPTAALCAAIAGAPSPEAGPQRPAWLSDASVSVGLVHDSSVFGVQAEQAAHPGFADRSAWVTTVGPRLTLDLRPLLGVGSGGPLRSFTAGYVGSYSFFDHVSGEDNAKHTLVLGLKASESGWSLALDNSLLFVDGGREGPFYSTYSAFSSALPRERRRQIQERPKLSLRRDFGPAFVRAVAASATYDLLVDRHNPVGAYRGYVNFVDRSDANAGLDLGYRAGSDRAYFVGWRVGRQLQARLPWGGTHSDNTYNRLLAGFEGKLLSWLSGSALVGPDFRRYTDAANRGIAGADHTWLYAEGSLSARIAAGDSLSATTKVWHWVSGTGSTSYQDATYALTWKHAVGKRLSLEPGVKFLASKYDYPAVRNDQAWALSCEAACALSRRCTISASYSWFQSRSRIPEAIAPGRGVDLDVASVSVKWAL
ncbi:hypothetical protein GALL_113250 [mine drainage metagenome]|uniref:Uncharacterized protein n=1 Tax=mine drainage metagenome TaxID=410659 RepID=A0A1J5SDF2_9ZZZZ